MMSEGKSLNRSGRGFALMLVCLVIAGIALAPAYARGEELLLLCGAGLRQPVDRVLPIFQQETGIKVVVEYGGSGQQITQYESTGLGDVLLSGSYFYVEKVQQKGKVAAFRKLVVHAPVLAVNKEKKNLVKTFGDLAKPGVTVGLGDPKSMALGRTAVEILKHSGMEAEILKNVTVRAATVKQLALYLVQGDVDAAIIGMSDVFQDPTLGRIEIDPAWYTADIVAAAVLNTSKKTQAATKLLDFLASPKVIETFGQFGFPPYKQWFEVRRCWPGCRSFRLSFSAFWCWGRSWPWSRGFPRLN